MGFAEDYYWEEREHRRKIEALKMQGKKKVYEWIFKRFNGSSWCLSSALMDEDEAKRFFEDSLGVLEYRKTDRSFIVEVSNG